jgi:hypothetical protein
MVCSNCKQSGHNIGKCKMKKVESTAEAARSSMLKDDVVKAVQEHPLTTDWSALSERVGRTETYLRSLYNKTVPAVDHVRRLLETLSDEWMMELMEKEGHECIKCHSRMYCSPKRWEGAEYCGMCYKKSFSDEISSRWKMVNEYARSTSKDKCNICNVGATYNKEIGECFSF